MAFLFLLNASCNKIIDEVPLPPFDVFPNPCKNQFSIAFNPVFFAGESVEIRLLYGNETLVETTLPAPGNINIDMRDREAGVYHVEVIGRGQTFISSVLKVN